MSSTSARWDMRRPEFTTDHGGTSGPLTRSPGPAMQDFAVEAHERYRRSPWPQSLVRRTLSTQDPTPACAVKAELLDLSENPVHVAWVLAENAAFRHHRESLARAITNFAKSRTALVRINSLRGPVSGARDTVVTRRSVIFRSDVSSWRWCFERLSPERSAKKAAAEESASFDSG